MEASTDQLLTKLEVAELLGIALSTLESWVYKRHFPRPIQIGKRAVRYRLSVVEAWIREKEATAAVSGVSKDIPP